jgi:hypothetical protein
VGDFKSAVASYCKSVIQDLEQDNFFTAGYYLKEVFEQELVARMFEEAYKRSAEKNDLWWQVRALQELGWTTELRELLEKNRSSIEESDNTLLRQALYAATGQREKFGHERLIEAMAVEALPGLVALGKASKPAAAKKKTK